MTKAIHNDRLWLWLVGITFFLLLVLGCTPSHPADDTAYSPIPMTASAVDKAGAHVSSADALTKQASPTANDTGKALLTAASAEHDKALSALTDARKELSGAAKEKADLQAADAADKATAAKLNASWGHKLQVWVTRLLVLLVVLASLHFLALAASLFLPPPYSMIAGVVGKVVNPVGWFQAVIDHLHLRGCEAQVVALSPATSISDGLKTILDK